MREWGGWKDRVDWPDIAAGCRAACSSRDPGQRRLISSEPPDELLRRFEALYLSLTRQQWPHLVPRAERFAQYAEFVRGLGVRLEDYSQDHLADNPVVRLQLDRLNSQLANAAAMPDEDAAWRRQWTADLVADVLMSACLVPSSIVLGPDKHDTDQHFDYTGEVSRHWIQGLPMDLVEEMIKELRLGCSSSRGLQHSVLMCTMDVEAYANMTVAQRICHVALSNFSAPFRRVLLASPLVNEVLAAPDLSQWMLSCSGFDEQYWLNTCEVAARNGMLATRLPTVAHCIVLTRDIVSHIRSTQLLKLPKDKPWTRTLWGGCYGVPSVREYCRAVLDAVDEELDGLEQRIRSALQMDSSLEKKKREIQEVLQAWNKTTQFLSSVYAPAEPVVLSCKAISDQWQRSAKLAAFPCLFGMLVPGQPLVMSRNEGTLGEYDRSGSRFAWRDRLAPQSFPQFKDISKRMRDMGDEEARTLLAELWGLALSYGGLFFASQERIFGVAVGHLNGLYAMRLPDGTPQFLVGDPEIRRFKWLSTDEMRVLVTSDKVSFDLFDV